MMNVASLKAPLSQYGLGELLKTTPLLGGTVNSNYLIETTQGQFVFTLLEAMPIDLARPLSEFLIFLNQHDFPTPKIQYTRTEAVLIEFQHKPSLVLTFMPGKSPVDPSLKQCHQIGSALGQLHELTQGYVHPLVNTMNDTWRVKAAAQVMPQLSQSEQQLVRATLAAQAHLPYDQLSKGIVHFDLFRDNTLFLEERLEGIIDFYYACYDTLLIDLSIAINDWCTDWQDPKRKILPEKVKALMTGYEEHRALMPIEHQSLPTMLKISALHFWLARTLSHQKNPNDYKKIFLNHFF